MADGKEKREQEEEEEDDDDEAGRLKTLAEEKYCSSNLKSALKYAKRGHRLNPNLPGLSGMLAAFKVLRVSSEPSPLASEPSPPASSDAESSAAKVDFSPADSMDWYRILQLERFSHINSIKKQYKKLALLLHPDKNHFAGAEEAFKLVGEALRVLSDRIRRKEYDTRLRIAMQSEATKGIEVDPVDTFWTVCSTCRLLHQFERKYIGHDLVCPKCKKSFKAVEVPEDQKHSKNIEDEEGKFQTRTSARIRARGFLGKRRMSSVDEVLQRSNARRIELSETLYDAGNLAREKRSKRSEELNTNLSNSAGAVTKRPKLRRGQKLANGNDNLAKKGGRKVLKRLNKEEDEMMTLAEMRRLVKCKVIKDKVYSRLERKGNKHNECMEKNMIEEEMAKEKNNEQEEMILEREEEVREKQNEGEKENENLTNEEEGEKEKGKKDEMEISELGREEEEKADEKEKETDEEDMENDKGDQDMEEMENDKDDQHKEEKEENNEVRTRKARERRAVQRYGFTEFENERQSKRTSSNIEKKKGSNEVDQESLVLETPCFYDFDRDRLEKRFKKGQLWAIYNDNDRMPRHYGMIDEIFSLNPFEVRLRCLDLEDDGDESLIRWGRRGFHMSCGKFKFSRKSIVKSASIFSHVVDCERAAIEVYRIYPKKGSVWALYSDIVLNAEERSTSAKDKLCYDVVVFLTSYSEINGLSLACLERVDGFKTVFRRKEIGCNAIRWLGNVDFRLFSHQIPARKLSGEEAPGLSKECWELDVAALPPEMLTAKRK